MSELTRRNAVKLLAATGATAATGCASGASPERVREENMNSASDGAAAPIVGEGKVAAVTPLGHPWSPPDPFLACMYHLDAYPKGNDRFGPDASLAGRQMGRDFAGVDGWNMYHGEEVPGFPKHPHRGFETVTVVRQGRIDHSDSLGARARYGDGDVQWLTTGAGVQHAEMFPLLNRDDANPTELFQIWLNLPAASKMVQPYFSMLWAERIPKIEVEHEGARTEIAVIAGAIGEARPPAPPPDSWGSNPASDLAIWTVSMEAGGRWDMPALPEGANRSLFFFEGSGLRVGGQSIPEKSRVDVETGSAITLEASGNLQLLVLQGRPIGEPVAQYGPFVMNTESELRQAFADYQRTQFGGWPFDRSDPVHGDEGRFARHADGTLETPT